MLCSTGGRTLTAMTITFATQTVTDGADQPGAAELIVLDGGLLFQPSAVVEQAQGLADEGVPLTVSMSLDALDQAPLTGVSRRLIDASVESRLRQALHTAGYRSVTRRAVGGAIVLDASV
jgi:hypothetical protein